MGAYCADSKKDPWYSRYLSTRPCKQCPEGFETTFPRYNGECQQYPTENEGEYGGETGLIIGQCGQKCYQDADCVAFDFKDGSCYLNTRCDYQDEGDGYLSCKKRGTVSGARTTGIRSEAESMVAVIRSENDRLKHVNEVLKKTLET